MIKKPFNIFIVFLLTFFLLLAVFYIAINTGGIKIGISQLLRGMFLEYDSDVAIVLQLRFPRIIVAILGGGLMAVSGVLMQAVMRNPLADPGIIGVTSGAAFAAVILTAFFPAIAFLTPIFSFAGGMLAFLLVYILAMKGDTSPVKLILIGIAVNTFFAGLYQLFQSATGSVYSGGASIINANITLKEWSDVLILLIYSIIAMLLSFFIANRCNLLSLSDKTVLSLGIDIKKSRFFISMVSVLTASIFTAIIGSVSFLGLIVPHIARLLVGSDHKRLIPYSALLGPVVFLLADTIGRSIAYPYEISPAVIMSIIGGPVFILLLKRNYGAYGK